jgi:hypothetical protein
VLDDVLLPFAFSKMVDDGRIDHFLYIRRVIGDFFLIAKDLPELDFYVLGDIFRVYAEMSDTEFPDVRLDEEGELLQEDGQFLLPFFVPAHSIPAEVIIFG